MSYNLRAILKTLHQQCIGHENDIQSCHNIAQSVYSFTATHSQL